MGRLEGGRGHFIHPAIYCTTTWCFALKGLRTSIGTATLVRRVRDAARRAAVRGVRPLLRRAAQRAQLVLPLPDLPPHLHAALSPRSVRAARVHPSVHTHKGAPLFHVNARTTGASLLRPRSQWVHSFSVCSVYTEIFFVVQTKGGPLPLRFECTSQLHPMKTHQGAPLFL